MNVLCSGDHVAQRLDVSMYTLYTIGVGDKGYLVCLCSFLSSYILRFLKVTRPVDKEGSDAIAAHTAVVNKFSRNVGSTWKLLVSERCHEANPVLRTCKY